MKIYILVTHDDVGEDLTVRAFHTLLAAVEAMRQAFADNIEALNDAAQPWDPDEVTPPTLHDTGLAEYRIPGCSAGQIQIAEL